MIPQYFTSVGWSPSILTFKGSVAVSFLMETQLDLVFLIFSGKREASSQADTRNSITGFTRHMDDCVSIYVKVYTGA